MIYNYLTSAELCQMFLTKTPFKIEQHILLSRNPNLPIHNVLFKLCDIRISIDEDIPFNVTILDKYIKHIHITRHRDTDDDVENHIIPRLKELNIPYTHHKSYNVVKEDFSIKDWKEFYLIECLTLD